MLGDRGIDVLGIMVNDAVSHIQASSLTLPHYIEDCGMLFSVKRNVGDSYDYYWVSTRLNGVEVGCVMDKRGVAELQKNCGEEAIIDEAV